MRGLPILLVLLLTACERKPEPFWTPKKEKARLEAHARLAAMDTASPPTTAQLPLGRRGRRQSRRTIG